MLIPFTVTLDSVFPVRCEEGSAEEYRCVIVINADGVYLPLWLCTEEAQAVGTQLATNKTLPPNALAREQELFAKLGFEPSKFIIKGIYDENYVGEFITENRVFETRSVIDDPQAGTFSSLLALTLRHQAPMFIEEGVVAEMVSDDKITALLTKLRSINPAAFEASIQ